MANEPGEGGDAASPDELYAAVEKLSAREFRRLEAVGNSLALGIRGVDGADVLLEAVERALRGTSVWRRGVPLQNFLFGIMRNVAKQRREQKSSSAPAQPIVGHASDDAAGIDLRSEEPNPEEVLLAREAEHQREADTRETLQAVDALFEEDVEVQAILYGIRNGHPAAQVRQDFGMTETQYASARKRMNRALVKAFPGRVRS